jgi:hypothetical protein
MCGRVRDAIQKKAKRKIRDTENSVVGKLDLSTAFAGAEGPTQAEFPQTMPRG